MTSPTIRDVVNQLYAADVISDYHLQHDCTRLDLGNGWWIAVGPDFDPEHPENDAAATGYVFTVYDSDDNAIDFGGDDTTATLAARIRAEADTASSCGHGPPRSAWSC